MYRNNSYSHSDVFALGVALLEVSGQSKWRRDQQHTADEKTLLQIQIICIFSYSLPHADSCGMRPASTWNKFIRYIRDIRRIRKKRTERIEYKYN